MSEMKSAIKMAAITPLEVDDAESLSRDFRFGTDFLGFGGHFPGYPLVPAVVQLLTAQTLVEEHLGEALKISSVVNAKFLLQLRPDVDIRVVCSAKDGDLKYQVKLFIAEDTAASFTLCLEREQA